MIQIILSVVLTIAVIIGITMMSKVRWAVAGNMLSALAMLVAVVSTLCFVDILTPWTILVSLLVGSLIGVVVSIKAQMIQMPQLVAAFNGLGGGASALVGLMTILNAGSTISGSDYPVFVCLTAMLAIAVGTLTLVGSMVAAGKLARLLNQRPVQYRCHSLLTILVLVLTIVVILVAAFTDLDTWYLALAAVLFSALFGWLFAIRVGGADMPITISLLNSLSGVAGSIAGMATGDILLVAVGGIVGASGLLLTQIMCKAMNRSLVNILLPKEQGARRKEQGHDAEGITSKATNEVKIDPNRTDFNTIEELISNLSDMEIQQLLDAVNSLTNEIAALRKEMAQLKGGVALDTTVPANTEPQVEKKQEATDVLKAAKDVIIVPGYGMALAQAQHIVKQLADNLAANGTRVRFAIHPVAGRMPGHMNVLLAEADIPYDDLYEMEAINDEFKNADAVVVIGANDVLNPAARNAEGTPIYGMPVLNVDEAPNVIVCNYDLNPGYAGVENPLYTRNEGVWLCLGDAKETLMKLIKGL